MRSGVNTKKAVIQDIRDYLPDTDDMVTGPSFAENSHIVEFDKTTGRLIKDGGLRHDDIVIAILNLLSAYDETALTIASGAITVTGSAIFRNLTIDTEGSAATDDLTTINGGAYGEIAYLSAANDARTVVVKNGANLKLQADFSLNSTADLLVLKCISSGVWKEVSRANNGA